MGATAVEPCREWAQLRCACFHDCNINLRKILRKHERTRGIWTGISRDLAGCHCVPREVPRKTMGYRRGITVNVILTSSLRRSYMVIHGHLF